MAAQRSNARSFEEVVRSTQRGLLGYAMMLTAGDLHRAEDLLSAVYARAFERWQQIRNVDSVFGYLRRMVSNEFVTGYRRGGRVELREAMPDAAGRDGDFDTALTDRDDLTARLSALPHQQRAVLVLRYYYDLPFDEIATELNCRPATARGYAVRGLAALRISMSEAATDTSTHHLTLIHTSSGDTDARSE